MAFEVALPKASTELLNLYLQTYRPRIKAIAADWIVAYRRYLGEP